MNKKIEILLSALLIIVMLWTCGPGMIIFHEAFNRFADQLVSETSK